MPERAGPEARRWHQAALGEGEVLEEADELLPLEGEEAVELEPELELLLLELELALSCLAAAL